MTSERPTREPDWRQANPIAIERAVERALAKPSGGWFVLDAARTIHKPIRKPIRNPKHKLPHQGFNKIPGIHKLLGQRIARSYVVNGVELVAWADPESGAVTVAPALCPHMGAHMGDGHLDAKNCIVCPWHGLALPPVGAPRVVGQGRWEPWRTHDDGILIWVQPDPSAPDATDAPILTKRPDAHFTGVIRREATCEPRDIIANRLDPWHGVHFHPYAFGSLEVLSNTDNALDLRAGYRVTPRHVLEVEARFDCPDPRTIVMTITGGEGTGSVVETHATPMQLAGPTSLPRTAIIEATLATSDRPGFAQALKGAALARPMIELLAGRLWKDDALYAERICKLRSSR